MIELTLIEQIEAGIKPSVFALGFEVWGVELQGGREFKTLRIYIDGPNGISVDDCAKVSADVGAILDVEDWLSVEYNLEVSSPGMDRVFFRWQQLSEFIGEELSVKLKQAVGGRFKFIGRLLSVENGRVNLLVEEKVEGEDDVLEFEFASAAKVRLVPRY